MNHPTSPLAVSRARAAKLARLNRIERLEDRIAPAYTATLNGSTVTFNGDAANDIINFESVGGFLKHSLASSFDTNYASDFDMVSGDGSTETKLSTGGAFTVVVNAGDGKDGIILGSLQTSAAAMANGTFNLHGQGDTGGNGGDPLVLEFSTETADRTLNISATTITTPGGPTVNYDGMEFVSFSLGGGHNTYNLTGSAAGVSYNLTGGNGANPLDTVNVTADGNFTLSNTTLTVAAPGFASPFNIGGGSFQAPIKVVNLTGGTSGNQFDLSGWTRSGKLTGGGGGDVVIVTRDTNFTLIANTLGTSDGMSVTLAAVNRAELTGGASNNTFDVTSRRNSIVLNGGAGDDIFNVTLGDPSALSNLITVNGGADHDTLNVIGTSGDDFLSISAAQVTKSNEQVNYAEVEAASVDGSDGADTFTVSGTAAGVSYELIGGANAVNSSDIVSVVKDGDFNLTGNLLTVTFPGFNSPIKLTMMEGAALFGLGGANRFTVNGWQGTAALSGDAGNDVFDITLNGVAGATTISGETESDTVTINGTGLNDLISIGAGSVTAGSETVSYGSIETLNVNGLAGDDTFTVLGSAAGVTYNLDGGTHTLAGQDRIEATADGNFVLTDSLLTVTATGFNSPFHLTAFNAGKLTGGGSSNDFTVSGWTGGLVTLNGGSGGNDRVIATAAGNFALTSTSLAITGGRNFALTHIFRADLTGDANANQFTVSDWLFDVNLDGGGAGADVYDIAPNWGGSGIFKVTGGADEDALIVKGTASPDLFNPSPGTVQRLGTLAEVDYTGIESVTVDGQGGNDPLTISSLTPPVAAGVAFHYVGGGQDGDVLGFTGLGLETLTWTPGAANAGTVLLGTNTYTYASANGGLEFTTVNQVLLQTPAGADDYTLTSATITAAGQKAFLQSVSNVVIDLATGDGGAATADTFTVQGALSGTIAALEVKLGAGPDRLKVNDLFLLVGVSFTADGGADSPDTLSFTSNGVVTLTPTALQLGAGQIDLSGFEQFDLSVGALTVSGTAAETVTWQPGVFAFGGGTPTAHAGSLIIENGALPTHTVIYKVFAPASGGPAQLALRNVNEVDLETPAGADVFTLGAGFNGGELNLGGTIGNADAHEAEIGAVAILGADFGKNDPTAAVDKLTVSSLDLTGLKTLTVSTGDGDDTLELASTLTALGLGTNPGEGFSFDGGAGSDTLKAASSSPLNLGVTTLAIGSGGTLAHSNTEVFNLDAGVNGQVNYTGDGTDIFAWTPNVALTQQGNATFSTLR